MAGSDALTHGQPAFHRRDLLLVVIGLDPLGRHVERVTGLHADVLPRRRVANRRLTDQLDTPGRVRLVELEGPAGERAVTEGAAAGPLECVPDLHRRSEE